MTVENISWSISTKECCRPRRESNPRPPGLQSDTHPTEPPMPRRDSRGDEREGQGRKRNMNESEEAEEIKTYPPLPLQCTYCKDSRPCPVSWTHRWRKIHGTFAPPDHPYTKSFAACKNIDWSSITKSISNENRMKKWGSGRGGGGCWGGGRHSQLPSPLPPLPSPFPPLPSLFPPIPSPLPPLSSPKQTIPSPKSEFLISPML